jgi:hypothetical protein
MKDFLDELDKEISGSEVSKEANVAPVENKAESVEKPADRKPKRHINSKKPQQKKKPSAKDTEVRGRFVSTFPETKFYLPALREGYTRFIPIGGNNETGAKNMGMAQY